MHSGRPQHGGQAAQPGGMPVLQHVMARQVVRLPLMPARLQRILPGTEHLTPSPLPHIVLRAVQGHIRGDPGPQSKINRAASAPSAQAASDRIVEQALCFG